MARKRFRSVIISLVACLIACESGCSPRGPQEDRAQQENSAEQTRPNIESAGEQSAASTAPQKAESDLPIAVAKLSTGLAHQNDQERTLRISVRGFASTSGNCRIAVYSNSASFNQPEKAALRAILPIEGETAIWEPSEEEMMKLSGELAIAAFQDRNENERLDKNSLGIPTERYGFSNNPKRGFGPPTFQQAKFTLSDGIKAINIEIR